jgi:hypothetical protein
VYSVSRKKVGWRLRLMATFQLHMCQAVLLRNDTYEVRVHIRNESHRALFSRVSPLSPQPYPHVPHVACQTIDEGVLALKCCETDYSRGQNALSGVLLRHPLLPCLSTSFPETLTLHRSIRGEGGLLSAEILWWDGGVGYTYGRAQISKPWLAGPLSFWTV